MKSNHMTAGEILSSGLDILRKNMNLILPPIIAMFIIVILNLFLESVSIEPVEPVDVNDMNGEQTQDLSSGFTAFDVMQVIAAFVIQTLTHGMVVAMVRDILQKGSSSLRLGLRTALSKMGSLLIATLLIGLLAGIGMSMYVIPGLVVLFIFMFTFTVIIVGDFGPFSAMSESVRIVRNHFSDTFKLYLVIIGIFLLTSTITVIMGRILILGQLVNAILTGGLIAYISIILMIAYNSLLLSGESA